MADPITLSQLRAMANDIDVPDEEIAQYILEDSSQASAFRPGVTINSDVVDDQWFGGEVVSTCLFANLFELHAITMPSVEVPAAGGVRHVEPD